MHAAADPPQRGDHGPLGHKPLGTKQPGSADPAAMFTVDDFQAAARDRLESSVYDFIVDGTGNEDSVSHNREALQRLRILSRTMTDVEFKHLPGPSGGGLESNLTWEMFEWLRGVTDLPIVLKGILDPADAARAVDEGANGISVSHHRGRQVAGAVSAWDVLPEVAERVAGKIQVLGPPVRTGPRI